MKANFSLRPGRWRAASCMAAFTLIVVGICVVVVVEERIRFSTVSSALSVHEASVGVLTRTLRGHLVGPLAALFAMRNHQTGDGTPVIPTDWAEAHEQIVTPQIKAIFRALNQTLVSLTTITHSARQDYETKMSLRCSSSLPGLSWSILPIACAPTRQSQPGVCAPTPAAPFYTMTTLGSASAGTAADCVLEGAEIGGSPLRIGRYLAAIETGRVQYAPPYVPLTGYVSIGAFVPILVPYVSPAPPSPAGVLGDANAAMVASRPDMVKYMGLDVLCAPVGRLQCGQAHRALGVVSMPVDVDGTMQKLATLIRHVEGSQVVVAHVTDVRQLLQISKQKSMMRELLAAQWIEPLPDEAYLDTLQHELYSAGLEPNSLGPLLAALQPGDVAYSAAHEQNGHVNRIPAAQALDILRQGHEISVSGDGTDIQSASVFLAGSRVYAVIMRTPVQRSVAGLVTSYAVWIVGVVITLITASCPLVVHAIYTGALAREKQAVDLAKAEKEGVVQSFAFAAHELRQPLHGILASVNAARDSLLHLLKGHPHMQELFEDVHIACDSAEHCHRLINDMIDYSTLQKKGLVLDLRRHNLQALLRRALTTHRVLVRSNVKLVLQLARGVPDTVFTDESRAIQVIANGLANAAKYTHSGNIWMSAMVLDTSSFPALCMPHNPGNKWLGLVTCDAGKGLVGVDVEALFEPVKASVDVTRDHELRVRQNTEQSDSSPVQPSPRARSGKGGLTATQALNRKMDTWRRSTSRVRPLSPASSAPLAPAQAHSVIHVSRSGSSSSSTGAAGARGGATSEDSTPSSPLCGGVGPMPASPRRASPDRNAEPSPLQFGRPISRGSGLGLPVARLMARALGGDLDMYIDHTTPPNSFQVTRFAVVLPMSALQEPAHVLSQPTSRPQVPIFGRNSGLTATQQEGMRECIRQAFATAIMEKWLQIDEMQGGAYDSPFATADENSQRSATGATATLPDHTACFTTASGNPSCHPSQLSHQPSPANGQRRAVFAATTSGGVTESDSGAGAGVGDTDPAFNNTGTYHTAGTVMIEGRESSANSVVSDVCITPHGRMRKAYSLGQGDGSAIREQDEEVGSLRNFTRPPRLYMGSSARTLDPGAGSKSSRRSQDGATNMLSSVSGGGLISPMQSYPSGRVPRPLTNGSGTSIQLSSTGGAPVLRVLYADDDATNRRLMRRMLDRLSRPPLASPASSVSPGSAAAGSPASLGLGMLSPGSSVHVTLVNDGWEALCALYSSGQLSWAALNKAAGWIDPTMRELTFPHRARRRHSEASAALALQPNPSQSPFGLILLDIDMPRLSGDKVADILKADWAELQARDPTRGAARAVPAAQRTISGSRSQWKAEGEGAGEGGQEGSAAGLRRVHSMGRSQSVDDRLIASHLTTAPHAPHLLPRLSSGSSGNGSFLFLQAYCRPVPVLAVTGRCMGLELKEEWLQAVVGRQIASSMASNIDSSATLSSPAASQDSMKVVPRLQEEMLQASFDGTIGKPFGIPIMDRVVGLALHHQAKTGV